MLTTLLALALTADPALDGGTAALFERLEGVAPAGWTLKRHDGSVRLDRDGSVPLTIRGVADRDRTTSIAIVVTVGPRLTPKARASLEAENEKTIRARDSLAETMERFRGGEADSEPDYRPTTAAQRKLYARYQVLDGRIASVPRWYVEDFWPVSLTVWHGSGPSRRDEQAECPDCELVLQRVRERLMTYAPR